MWTSFNSYHLIFQKIGGGRPPSTRLMVREGWSLTREQYLNDPGWNGTLFMVENTMCTTFTTCVHDEGNPLGHDISFSLAGILSVNANANDCESPEVYTRVFPHLKWIQEHMWIVDFAWTNLNEVFCLRLRDCSYVPYRFDYVLSHSKFVAKKDW